MSPKLTVIMPSLNVVDYIKECIESVTNQSLRDIEILCIDAGSTDGTLEILNEYSRNDPRIQVIGSDRKSYGYQVNLGIRRAKGEYIGIVETDDFIEESMYEVLYSAAIRHDAEVVKCGRFEIYEFEDGAEIELPLDFIPQDRYSNCIIDPDSDPSVHAWEGNVWNGIYKRSFLEEHDICFNESEGAAFQDIGFIHLVMNYAEKMVYLRNLLYHYRKIRPGASTWNPKCLEFAYNEYRDLIESGRLKPSHLQPFYKLVIISMMYEYEKALMYADFDESKIECPEAVEWFSRQIKEAMENEIIKPDILNENDRERLLLLLADRPYYIRRLKQRVAALSDWLKMLRQKKGDRSIIIFGTGTYGTLMTQLLIRSGICPVALADNNIWLRSLTIYGLPVMSIDDAVIKYPQALFLICNKKNHGEMKKHLTGWGIQEDQIVVFDGSDPELLSYMRSLPILT